MYMGDITKETIDDIMERAEPLDSSEVQGDIKPDGVE